jgi:outer membrane beta-barrel protein
METRIRIFLLKVALGMVLILGQQATTAAQDAPSQQVIEPELDRREIQLAKIDTEDFEFGGYVGMMSIEDFGTDLVYGSRFAYHLTESFFVEAALGKSKAGKTSYELLSGAADLLTDSERNFTYYNASIGWNMLPGEVFLGKNRAFNSAVYLIAGIGSTQFAGDNHFTINIGAGIRFLASDWVALHLDIRDHMFDSDLLGEEKTTFNIESHLGVTFFF